MDVSVNMKKKRILTDFEYRRFRNGVCLIVRTVRKWRERDRELMEGL